MINMSLLRLEIFKDEWICHLIRFVNIRIKKSRTIIQELTISQRILFIQLMFYSEERTHIYNIYKHPKSYMFNKRLTKLIKIKSN